MSVKLENLLGNGSIKPNSIFNYNYSEEVSSLEPSTLGGATSQVSVSAISVNSELTDSHSDSKLLINNEMQLTDGEIGSVTYRVKSVSKNIDVVTIVGDTLQSKLNVERTALAHGGPDKNLLTAINYYCSLVDIVPVFEAGFESELEAVPVNFIGWKGILWEKLKELCAGFSASVDQNVGLEMVIINNELVFRKAKQNLINIDKELVSDSITIDSFESTKSVTVFNYNTSFGENQVFYQISNFDKDKPEEERFQSSINDSMQVNSGETIRKRFFVNASFTSVNQPVCVEQITRTFPDPYSGTTGEYVIVGTDDLPIKPDQWNKNGGSVTIELVDEDGEELPPGEIELVVKAPELTGLPKAADENKTAFAPYKIGVESSGEKDYAALWLTGTGVFFEKKEKVFLTGSSDEYTSSSEGPTVDNIFITNSFNVSSRGVAAAQANCGPRISVNRQIAQGVSFGDIGSLFISGLNKYRINSLTFNNSSISLTASGSLSIAEWNEIWTDLTFEDFNNKVLDPELFPEDALRFNEFTIIPRIGV
jgi:hypothetical protein